MNQQRILPTKNADQIFRTKRFKMRHIKRSLHDTIGIKNGTRSLAGKSSR